MRMRNGKVVEGGGLRWAVRGCLWLGVCCCEVWKGWKGEEGRGQREDGEVSALPRLCCIMSL